MTITNALVTTTAALVASASSIGRAERLASGSVSAWAAAAAEALINGTADLDAIGVQIVEAVKARHSRGPLSKLERISQLARTDYAKGYHWHRDLVRVHEAGLTAKLLASETGNDGKPYSLQMLRRGETDASDKPAPTTGKGGRKAKAAPAPAPEPTPNATVALPPLTMTLAQMADFLEAEQKRLSFKALRNMQPELSRILHAVGAMARTVETGIAAEVKAAAAKAAAKATKAAARKPRARKAA